MVTPTHVIAYYSVHHGNTRAVAEAMADATGAPAVEAHPDAIRMIQDARLVGFGSGIFFGSHHKDLLAFVHQLQGAKGLQAFIFSTSGTGYRPARIFGRDYHRRLRHLLSAAGCQVIGEFACRGYDTYGPWGKLGGVARGHPDAKELSDARAFAIEMVKKSNVPMPVAGA